MYTVFQNILAWIYGWIGNYGWSIVMFTLLVRIVLLPLDIKSKKSMRAMQKIQPKVNALQKKYANDKEKLNVKLNELYKKEHVSPMSGCLPLLISLPVLWWMFGAMRNMASDQTVQMLLNIKTMTEQGMAPAEIAELIRHGGTAAGLTIAPMESWLWIKNVFQPDSFLTTILPQVGDTLKNVMTVKGSAIATADNIAIVKDFIANSAAYAEVVAEFGTFSKTQLTLLIVNPVIYIPHPFTSVFSVSNGLFILPLAAGLSQFLMTKITSGTQTQPDANENPEAAAASNAMNSGFMKWFFPIFSLWICAGYNAAFAIYWMAANVIQIVQQLAVNWYFDRLDKKQALLEGEDATTKE